MAMDNPLQRATSMANEAMTTINTLLNRTFELAYEVATKNTDIALLKGSIGRTAARECRAERTTQ